MGIIMKMPPKLRLKMPPKLREAVLSIDRNGLLWVTEFRHPYLNRAMECLSRAGDWDVWTGILATLLVCPKGRPMGQTAVPRVVTAFALCLGLKLVARRARPSVGVEGFSTLVNDPDPYSFPSSHSACAWAACVSIARVVGGAGWLLPFYAALISYSRLHVGAHYPLDVVIGAGVGSAIAMR